MYSKISKRRSKGGDRMYITLSRTPMRTGSSKTILRSSLSKGCTNARIKSADRTNSIFGMKRGALETRGKLLSDNVQNAANGGERTNHLE